MGRDGQRVLAVSARITGLGCVLLEAGDLLLWINSEAGTKGPEAAVTVLRDWAKTYRPDVIITETPDAAGHKRGRQIAILRALLEAADDLSPINFSLRRSQPYNNAYEQARELARLCPEIARALPVKPPIWKSEHRNLAIFEALALARDAGLLKTIADQPIGQAEDDASKDQALER